MVVVGGGVCVYVSFKLFFVLSNTLIDSSLNSSEYSDALFIDKPF
jgi:hypothetical protein